MTFIYRMMKLLITYNWFIIQLKFFKLYHLFAITTFFFCSLLNLITNITLISHNDGADEIVQRQDMWRFQYTNFLKFFMADIINSALTRLHNRMEYVEGLDDMEDVKSIAVLVDFDRMGFWVPS